MFSAKVGRMDNDQTLHIRCGSDIEPALREAGFVGAFLDFSDPFCQGPVLDLPPEEFVASRLDFIVSAYGLDATEAQKKHRLRYARLANAAAYQKIILWFEHDSFDQLILMYLLKHFGGLEEKPAIELVFVDDFPVEPRFMGLGQLSPDQLKTIYDKREPVGDALFGLGAEVWSALVDVTPVTMVRLAQKDTPIVTKCAQALMRHLKELPAKSSGLSLTEELSLKILAGEGPLTGGKLFRALMLDHEPLPYLGDLMYWYDLGRLVDGGAITAGAGDWAERELAITDLGRACLKGDADWMDHVKVERYVGGIRVAPEGKIWRRQG